MKVVTTAILTVSLLCAAAYGQIIVPAADGSDGVFAPQSSIQVDLSQAPNRPWDYSLSLEPELAGRGVYDHTKWAVVFKYESVNIPSGFTVTFKNHPSRAPVVWLVSGDVTISGTVNLGGSQGHWPTSVNRRANPGPGGFRGGRGSLSLARESAGLGPGGTTLPTTNGCSGVGGSYGRSGAGGQHYEHPCGQPGPVYGNLWVFPMIGGSGGGGSRNAALGGQGGGGGGGVLFRIHEARETDYLARRV